MTEKRKATSIRFSDEADRLIRLLAAKLGIKRSAVIELAIRKFAEQEQVRRPDDDYRDPDQQRL
jgi:predicted transcriptional regulator